MGSLRARLSPGGSASPLAQDVWPELPGNHGTRGYGSAQAGILWSSGWGVRAANWGLW